MNRTSSINQFTHLNQSNLRAHLNPFHNHLSERNRRQMSRQTSEIDLRFEHQTPDQFYVPIETWETLEKRTKFTVYKLKVENLRTGEFWFVYRRFTDFQRLDDKLKASFPNLDLNLPGKSFFENVFNPLFIEKRQLGLQLYLNRLMTNRQLLNELSVKRFLCIDDPPMSADTFTYSSSMCSESCDQSSNQLYACNNCCLLERKLDEMQLMLDSKNAKINKLQNALDAFEIKNSSSE